MFKEFINRLFTSKLRNEVEELKIRVEVLEAHNKVYAEKRAYNKVRFNKSKTN